MNKREILMQLEDLKYNAKNFESFETTEDDVQALEYAINELKKEDSKKCNCCEENNYILTVDSIKLCKDCLEILKGINI